MRKKRLTLMLILLLLLFAAAAGPAVPAEEKDKEESMDFEKIKKEVITLFKEKKFAEASEIYQKALGQFPERAYDITFTLVQIYLAAGEFDRSLDMFEYGLKQKIVYPLWPAAPHWQSLARYERFKKILEENNRLRAELTARTEPQFNVVMPSPYSEKQRYPLFIVLHGWDDSLKNIEKHWKSTRIHKECLLVLTQSSQVVSPTTFGWEDTRRTRKDITEIFEKVSGKYPVDKDKVIVCGFSQGGRAALYIAVNHIIPAAGFVVLQPGGGIPEDFNVETVKNARQRGLRGTLILRAQDQTQEEQVEIRRILETAGFPYRYITSGTGHWYPENFPELLDEAVGDIIDR